MTPIREYLGKWSMLALADVGRPFEQSVESVVLVGAKIPKGGQTRVWTDVSALRDDPALALPWETISHKASIWNPFVNGGGKYPNRGNLQLPRLGEFFDAVRGIEMGKSDDAVFTEQGKGRFRLLRGEDVAPFRVDYSGYWVLRERANDRVYKPLHLYTHPMLMVRRVASRPIAALSLDTDYHVLNTIYVLVPKGKLPYAIEVYCALLNSDFVNDWFHATFLNDDKLFPYIRKAQLLDIPILTIPRDGEQYDRLLKAAKTAVRDNGQNQASLEALSRLVDEIAESLMKKSQRRVAER